MFTAIQLQNFKPFGEPVRVRIAPITLLFGQNSSGKSSFIQSLYMLKQTIEARGENSALVLHCRQGYVDLGTYPELLYGHDVENRRLHIRFDVRIPESIAMPRRIEEWIRDLGVQTLGLDLCFGLCAGTIFLSAFDLYVGDDTEPLAKYERLDRPEPDSEPGDLFDLLSPHKTIFFQCTHLSLREEYWRYAFSKRSKASEWLEYEYGENWQEYKESTDSETEEAKTLEFIRKQCLWLKEVSDIAQYVNAVRPPKMGLMGQRGFLPGYSGLPYVQKIQSDPFYAPLEDGDIVEIESPEEVKNFYDFYLWNTRYLPYAIDPHELVAIVSHVIERDFGNLRPIGPLRDKPTRSYLSSGKAPSSVDFDGSNAAEILYRSKRIREAVNEWLDRLDVGYSVEPAHVGPTHSGMYEIRLRDLRQENRPLVSLADVGFGVNQILPIVVQCLCSKKQIILIEQPEIHIHPGLQARLGSLFEMAIRPPDSTGREDPLAFMYDYPPYSNYFIVETHSEHLILRLQRLIRDKKLRPEEVSVNFFERGPTGSTVRELRLDENGEFLDDWPGGFFPERLRELIE